MESFKGGIFRKFERSRGCSALSKGAASNLLCAYGGSLSSKFESNSKRLAFESVLNCRKGIKGN